MGVRVYTAVHNSLGEIAKAKFVGNSMQRVSDLFEHGRVGLPVDANLHEVLVFLTDVDECEHGRNKPGLLQATPHLAHRVRFILRIHVRSLGALPRSHAALSATGSADGGERSLPRR